jgi:hypothetical protein
MSKVPYDLEKVRAKKRLIGVVAITLLIIVTILALVLRLNFIVWVLLDLSIYGAANLLLRRVGRAPSIA